MKTISKSKGAGRHPQTTALSGMNGVPAWLSADEVIRDYRIAIESRNASILGRREVLTGKAKFGIFGDGKEVVQLAMARAFEKGDWRSGYYRDQTFMFSIGESTIRQFFAQLYAHTDITAEPASAGRSMNGHFATRFLDDQGNLIPLSDTYNVSADVSPTGSQMPRLVGLAQASVLLKHVKELANLKALLGEGSEVAWGTIGNASCAEGMFWESVNAIGVLNAPAIISIWDDGYGISVPNEYQVTKGDIGALLKGFKRSSTGSNGFEVFTVKAWQYPELLRVYEEASRLARTEHVPSIIHCIEVTQPLGHSTSGSHERYKAPERLAWELEFDGVSRMRQWILDSDIASEEELSRIESEAVEFVRSEKEEAWKAYSEPIRNDVLDGVALIQSMASELDALGNKNDAVLVTDVGRNLESIREPFRRDVYVALHNATRIAAPLLPEATKYVSELRAYYRRIDELYSSHLYADNGVQATSIAVVPAQYNQDSETVNGSVVMNACFRAALSRDPRLLIFGEDVGRLGDVNQGCIGLQDEFGHLRVADVGIRETTIVGQAIGLAMRGLRPIAEIQYLDYLLYCLQLISDDLATVHWRTRGGQKAPAIIRTRGHRLEGVWHAGSPMAGIINLTRGVHVCVPRDMTQAAGMYNTLLKADDPAIVIEVLNGYRLKERLPDNIGEFTVPLGVPELLREGSDTTIVTYGACIRPCMDAAMALERFGINVEILDVQTLLPFDLSAAIRKSLSKTGALVVVDEDVPGGATAFMLRHILEEQTAWNLLDAPPRTVTATEHRPAYGTDGSYWSKPEAEDIFDAVYGLIREQRPNAFPDLGLGE